MKVCAGKLGPWTTPKPGRRCCLKLYEGFFKVALNKDAERLGIVFTPVEVVDFILQSADHALQQHFGRRLTSENVHILDPFTGTGTFYCASLTEPGTDPGTPTWSVSLPGELSANEIVLLAYYIAAINIEEATTGGAAWTAPMRHSRALYLQTPSTWADGRATSRPLCPSTAARQKQQEQDITVIVGNPPYSAGNGVRPMKIPMCPIRT